MSIERNTHRFGNLVETSGVPIALEWLNSGVPHRYSAIYRFQNEMFENLYFYDKNRQPIAEFLEFIPFEVSFCQYVSHKDSFSINNSALDPRLDGHMFQGIVMSYPGVPLFDELGCVCGTLCHFDEVAFPISDSELKMLKQASRGMPAELLMERSPRSAHRAQDAGDGVRTGRSARSK